MPSERQQRCAGPAGSQVRPRCCGSAPATGTTGAGALSRSPGKAKPHAAPFLQQATPTRNQSGFLAGWTGLEAGPEADIVGASASIGTLTPPDTQPTGEDKSPIPRDVRDCSAERAVGSGAAVPAAEEPSPPPSLAAESGTPDAAPATGTSPRAKLVSVLAEAVAAAIAAGDLHAARVAHEAIGRLIAEPDPAARCVADLDSERRNRGRR